jgi:carbamate kinase
MLIILTAVEKVALNFGKPDQVLLSKMSAVEAERYIEEGHFAPGSMLPKVQAALSFVQSGQGRRALITMLDKARDGLAGKTGTVICG